VRVSGAVRREQIGGRTFVMPVHWLFAFGAVFAVANAIARAVQRRPIHCAVHWRRLFARYNGNAIEQLRIGTLPGRRLRRRGLLFGAVDRTHCCVLCAVSCDSDETAAMGRGHSAHRRAQSSQLRT
jgi:hypothetical protein